MTIELYLSKQWDVTGILFQTQYNGEEGKAMVKEGPVLDWVNGKYYYIFIFLNSFKLIAESDIYIYVEDWIGNIPHGGPFPIVSTHQQIWHILHYTVIDQWAAFALAH